MIVLIEEFSKQHPFFIGHFDPVENFVHRRRELWPPRHRKTKIFIPIAGLQNLFEIQRWRFYKARLMLPNIPVISHATFFVEHFDLVENFKHKKLRLKVVDTRTEKKKKMSNMWVNLQKLIWEPEVEFIEGCCFRIWFNKEEVKRLYLDRS